MDDLTQLKVVIADHVATLTMNAPPVNALTRTLNDELTLALDRISELDEVRAVILHQTGFTWKPDNPLWPRVRAHFVVHRCGLISQCHRVETRMKYGSNFANSYAVTIEHEGNYPLSYDITGTPRYWKPEKYGSDVIDDAPQQVIAARALLAHLDGEAPPGRDRLDPQPALGLPRQLGAQAPRAHPGLPGRLDRA